MVAKDDIEVSNVEKVTSQMGHLANQEDHEETILQSLKRHPWPTVWVAYCIWVILATAFDFAAPSSVLGIPEFRKDFGSAYEGSYVLPAKWQSAFSGAPVATGCVGSLITGWLGEKIGRKLMFLIGFVVVFVGTTIQIIATTNEVFFAAKLIGGFSIGIGLSTAYSYMGEVAPVAIRGILTAAGAITFVLAQLIVALLLNYVGAREDRWSYRGIFLGQYVITAIAAVILPFMPESPYWLVARGNDAKARRALKSLGYGDADVDKRLANMKLTLEESRLETQSSSYLECFKKSNLRRTMVAVMPTVIQNMGGSYFIMAYLTYFAELSGFSTQQAFRINVGAQAMAFGGCVLSCLLVERVGRRPLNFYGTLVLTVILWVCGGLATKTESASCLKGSVAMFMLYLFVYYSTIGATAIIALAEIATPRLRIMTAAIGVILMNALTCLWAFAAPYLFNPNEANLGGKTAFIFGGFSILSTFYMWFCHPETAGRSYEELDEMFIKRVPTLKFKTFVTEAEIRGRVITEEVRHH